MPSTTLGRGRRATRARGIPAVSAVARRPGVVPGGRIRQRQPTQMEPESASRLLPAISVRSGETPSCSHAIRKGSGVERAPHVSQRDPGQPDPASPTRASRDGLQVSDVILTERHHVITMRPHCSDTARPAHPGAAAHRLGKGVRHEPDADRGRQSDHHRGHGWSRLLGLLAGAAPAAAETGTAPAARATSAGTWGTAEEVPGTAALNTCGGAETVSVSCASPGDCSAGRFCADSAGRQAFVVSQVSGAWGTAEEVPGTAALNTGGDGEISSVSCASPGDSSAGGWYEQAGNHYQAFVADETGGTWGAAKTVAADINKGGSPRSCRCRAPRQATAAPAAQTGARFYRPRSWSVRPTGPWAAPSSPPASRPLTRAKTRP